MDAWMHAVLWVFLTIGVCSGRKVAVSTGPLIRVEGQPVSIRCNVSEYEGPREQDFEWNMKRRGGGGGSGAARPSVNVISTFDSRYTDASLSARVAEGDVAVVRLGDSEVELRIGAARPTDGGLYSCHTPSTDSTMRGSYKADVELTVIPDTLVVSPAPVAAVTPEGGDITLSCTVTRQLLHPTFLSVTWSLRKTPSSSSSSSKEELVLSLGPLGAVTTGPGYAQRYAAGGLRLAPGPGGVFSVVLSRATAAADQGAYVCTGRQWTYEEGVARNVVERRGELGEVTVTPTGQSLNVTASSSSSSSSSSSPGPVVVSLGQSLGLLCTVAADNLALLALGVAWLRDGRHVVAAMDRGGVVAVQAAASNGSSGGGGGAGPGAQVALERTGPGRYRLALRGVTAGDAGAYTCRVRASVGGGGDGGRWHPVAEKTSAPVAVRVEQIKPTFSLALSAVLEPQATADPLELKCHMTNLAHFPPLGLLGVTWENTPPSGDNLQSAHVIGSLNHHGNLIPGPGYADRLNGGVMSLRRVEPHTFQLILLRTQEADMGQYGCSVSVWLPDGQGGVAKLAQELSSPITVSWTPKRPSLGVVAVRQREASVGGATFEMSCTVVPESLPGAGFSVLVQSQESVEGAVRTIMSLSPDGVLQTMDPQRRDSLMLTKSGPLVFTFRLAGVQLSDRGFYWCNVSGWTKPPPPLGGAGGGAGGGVWTQATSAESNKVRIDFQENGPSFAVAIQSDRSSVFPWETAKMECALSVSGSAPKSDDVAYEVSWFFSRLRGGHAPALLAAVDRYGVVRAGGGGPSNTSSDVSLERRNANTYLLRVHGTQDSDSGEYHCSATPWYLSAATGAWTQAQELTSPTVFLTVRFAVWESLKLPLLYGSMASLGVGIFSLALGLLCAHCCCRNTMHTPRSRNKLMDLEMD